MQDEKQSQGLLLMNNSSRMPRNGRAGSTGNCMVPTDRLDRRRRSLQNPEFPPLISKFPVPSKNVVFHFRLLHGHQDADSMPHHGHT